MKKILFFLLAIVVMTSKSSASVQPIKIKTHITIQQSISIYYDALVATKNCSTDACGIAALQATLGVQSPTSFDVDLEEEINIFMASRIDDLRCRAVGAAALLYYMNCAANCSVPYQGQCALQCASTYVATMYNANCMAYL